jgi:hypothetical protein
MIRTQIQLPEEQVVFLKKMAAAQHKSMAEIIRQAVDYFAKAKQARGRGAATEKGNGGRWLL